MFGVAKGLEQRMIRNGELLFRAFVASTYAGRQLSSPLAEYVAIQRIKRVKSTATWSHAPTRELHQSDTHKLIQRLIESAHALQLQVSSRLAYW